MDTSEFPANSDASRRDQASEKNIERVTSSGATRRRKSLRKQFRETFVIGDAKTAVRYAVMEVLLPAARDMVWETGSEYLRSLMFGESRRRGSSPPPSGPTGYVNYARYSHNMGGPRTGPQRALSRQARSQHDFDELVLDDRVEAEAVIDRLFDIVERYDSATVADLYELVGLTPTHTDNRWGWTDLHGAGVSRIRGGYLLDLPEPEPLH
jgi:hypothetical protein